MDVSDVARVLDQFDELLNKLKDLKPNDRSVQDRYWAITITDVEKALAVFYTFVDQDYNDG